LAAVFALEDFNNKNLSVKKLKTKTYSHKTPKVHLLIFKARAGIMQIMSQTLNGNNQSGE